VCPVSAIFGRGKKWRHFADEVLDFGPVAKGTLAGLVLEWDHSQHLFRFSQYDPTGGFGTFISSLPYSVSDSSPPGLPEKTVSAEAFPVNCVASQSVAYMDALFGAIYLY
jgi:hypothetical protein